MNQDEYEKRLAQELLDQYTKRLAQAAGSYYGGTIEDDKPSEDIDINSAYLRHKD